MQGTATARARSRSWALREVGPSGRPKLVWTDDGLKPAALPQAPRPFPCVGAKAEVWSRTAGNCWVPAEVVEHLGDAVYLEYFVGGSGPHPWRGKALTLTSFRMRQPSPATAGEDTQRSPDPPSSDAPRTAGRMPSREVDPGAFQWPRSGLLARALNLVGELTRLAPYNPLMEIVEIIDRDDAHFGEAGAVVPQHPGDHFRGFTRVHFSSGEEASFTDSQLTLHYPAKDLAAFFRRDYRLGLPWAPGAEAAEYRAAEDVWNVALLEHKATGIKVWREALDASGGSGRAVALFHYTSSTAFFGIVNAPQRGMEVWASLKDPALPDGLQLDTGFGNGVYATQHEPGRWRSKQQLLVNNFCRVAGFEHRADYCVPILVPEAWARHCETFVCGQHIGWDVQSHFKSHVFGHEPCEVCGDRPRGHAAGDELHRQGIGVFERDVWVINTSDESEVSRSVRVNFEANLTRRLNLQRRALGDDDWETIRTLDTLAQCLSDSGQHSAAVVLGWQALGGCWSLGGELHRNTIIARLNLAGLLIAQGGEGQVGEAQRLAREALAAAERARNGRLALEACHRLAEGLRAPDEAGEREALLRRAAEGLEAHSVDRRFLSKVQADLAFCLQERGAAAEAVAWLRRSLGGFREALSDAHPATINVCLRLARLLLEGGDAQEAEALARRAHEASRFMHGEREWLRTEARCLLVECLRAVGRGEEASGICMPAWHEFL